VALAAWSTGQLAAISLSAISIRGLGVPCSAANMDSKLKHLRPTAVAPGRRSRLRAEAFSVSTLKRGSLTETIAVGFVVFDAGDADGGSAICDLTGWVISGSPPYGDI